MNLAKFHAIGDSPAGDLVEKIMRIHTRGLRADYNTVYAQMAGVVKDAFEKILDEEESK